VGTGEGKRGENIEDISRQAGSLERKRDKKRRWRGRP